MVSANQVDPSICEWVIHNTELDTNPIDISILNALRRISMYQVKHLGVDRVEVIQNTMVYHNDRIIDRVKSLVFKWNHHVDSQYRLIIKGNPCSDGIYVKDIIVQQMNITKSWTPIDISEIISPLYHNICLFPFNHEDDMIDLIAYLKMDNCKNSGSYFSPVTGFICKPEPSRQLVREKVRQLSSIEEQTHFLLSDFQREILYDSNMTPLDLRFAIFSPDGISSFHILDAALDILISQLSDWKSYISNHDASHIVFLKNIDIGIIDTITRYNLIFPHSACQMGKNVSVWNNEEHQIVVEEGHDVVSCINQVVEYLLHVIIPLIKNLLLTTNVG